MLGKYFYFVLRVDKFTIFIIDIKFYVYCTATPGKPGVALLKFNNILKGKIIIAGASRWQHREILNLAAPTNKTKLQLHIQQFSMNKT